MKYRKLDANGDYSFGFGNNNFVTDAAAVTQAINTKLNMFQGECWKSVAEGLPFFQSIAGQSGTQANIAAIDLIFKGRILEAPETTSVDTYASNYDTQKRKYTATASVVTEYGTVEVSVG